MSNNYFWQISTQIKVDQLFNSKDKYSFLVGSGISVDAPSCLPTGDQLKNSVLNNLIPIEERGFFSQYMDPNRKYMLGPGDFLRFEQILEIIEKYDHGLHNLDFLTRQIINFNHKFLAEMALKKHSILTTNFDSLIEYALFDSENLELASIKPLINQADWNSHKTFLTDNKILIYKLHGSLVDITTGRDCRESLQATLSQISSNKSGLGLELWKYNVLKPIFENMDLIVLGYSGLDDFDVLPTLKSIKSDRRIIWVSHDQTRSIDNAQIETLIENTTTTNPENRDRIGKNLISFVENGSRSRTNIIRISVNTKELLKFLWRLYITNKPIPRPNETMAPFNVRSNATQCQKYSIAGALASFLNQHEKAKNLYDKAYEFSLSEEDKVIQVGSLINIGTFKISIDEIDAAYEYFNQAEVINANLDDVDRQRFECVILYDKGLINEVKGDLDAALNNYLQALERTNNIPDKRHFMAEIGKIYRLKSNIKEAEKYFQKAEILAKELGNVEQNIHIFNELGVLYVEKKDFSRAKKYYQDALNYCNEYGDFSQKSSILYNIADYYRAKCISEKGLDQRQKTDIAYILLNCPKYETKIRQNLYESFMLAKETNNLEILKKLEPIKSFIINMRHISK